MDTKARCCYQWWFICIYDLVILSERDFGLYKFNLKTGDTDVIENEVGQFKGKGCGLGYDEVKRKGIYSSGSGDSIRKFTLDGYDTLKVDCKYDQYMCWVVYGYVISRDYDWCKIGNLIS